MPRDSQGWVKGSTLGQKSADHPLSWMLAPAVSAAIPALDVFNLLIADAFVVGSAKMGETWRRLEIFTRLQRPLLDLSKHDVSD
jgi:hypothetical protein